MSKVTIRNLVIAAISLLIAVGVFTYMLLVSESQKDQLHTQLTAIKKREAQEASYSQMKRTIQESTQDRERIDSMFLAKESDSIDFLNLVESLAVQNAIALETKSLEVAEDKKTKRRWLLTEFLFSGDRENVEYFLQALEQLQYLAEITDFHLEARSSTNWQATVTVKVDIHEYVE